MQKEQQCFCGQQYSTETEQRNKRCIQCEKQYALCEEKVTQLSQVIQAALPLVHMIRKAIEAERNARILSSQEIPQNEPIFSYAYTKCLALNHVAAAFTHWAYVSARLWLLQEQEKGETKVALVALHQWSIEQFQRLFFLHLTHQREVLSFCEKHHILVTLQILDQSLDLSARL